MQPYIKQHMQSMCKALEEIVLPELVDKPFALEQAGLIAASFKLLIDIQEQEFAYLKQESVDSKNLLMHWKNENVEVTEHANSLAIKFDYEVESMNIIELKNHVPQLKKLINKIINIENVNNKSDVKLDHYIKRQLERENSWLRLTGFIPNSENILNIADVLTQQINEPL